MVQSEPWLRRDMAMIDQLKTIGIEQGKPFNPDAKLQQALTEGIAEAHAWLDNRYDMFFPPLPNILGVIGLCRCPMTSSRPSRTPTHTNLYPTDSRGIAYSYAFFVRNILERASITFSLSRTRRAMLWMAVTAYHLHVPPNVPVKQYWSMTAYDRNTHTLIRDTKWSSRSSTTTGLEKNADGSADIYFASTPPAGKESNWVPTVATQRFEALFRFTVQRSRSSKRPGFCRISSR